MKTARSLVENNLGVLRRITQVSTLVAVTAFLLSGQVGFDLDARNIVFFGSRIWPYEVALILFGLLVPLVLLAGFSLVFGRAFCGWLCPQTALSELVAWTQDLLKKSSARGAPYRAALFAGVAATALILALASGLALVSVFVSPQVIIRMLGGQISTSLLKGVTVASFLVLVDVAFLRHTFCEWICVMGWWQRFFAVRGALRVAFSTDRARECAKCSDCRNACFMRIEPRRRELPGTCLNCGKCVAACQRVMELNPAGGLIRYGFGVPGRWTRAGKMLDGARIAGFALVLVTVAGLLSWSVWSRPPVQIKVRQAQRFAVEIDDGWANGAYVVDIYNTSDSDVVLSLDETGLARESVTIEPNPVVARTGERVSAALNFQVDPEVLHPGRNAFTVTAVEVGGKARAVSAQAIFGLPVLPSGNHAASRDKEEHERSEERWQ